MLDDRPRCFIMPSESLLSRVRKAHFSLGFLTWMQVPSQSMVPVFDVKDLPFGFEDLDPLSSLANFHQVGVLEISISYVDSVHNITSNINIQVHILQELHNLLSLVNFDK